MSIINDALKKVQNSLSNSPDKPIIAPTETPSTGSNGAEEFSGIAAPPVPDAAAPTPSQISIPAAAMKATVAKTKETKMVYILGALCLLTALFAPILNHQSVFGLIIHSIPQMKRTAPRAAVVSHPQEPAAPTISSTVAQKAASIKEELTKSLTNLTAPSPSVPASTSSPRSGRKIIVSGVLAQGDKNVALIEGQVYEAGEMVDNVKIIAINPNSIVVNDNGLERTIKVGQL